MNKKIPILMLGLLLSLYSCEKDFEEKDITSSDQESNNNLTEFDITSIGKKLENPYSIKNMRLAYESLEKKGLLKDLANSKQSAPSPDIILPNYLYVKFEPQSSQQEAKLKKDSTRVLFDYPLDYEFTDEELDSRPELAEGKLPDYYAAIPINSEEAGEAQYQLIEELYIPEDDDYFDEPQNPQKSYINKDKIEDKEDFLWHLLTEAYQITGNEYDSEKNTDQSTQKLPLGSKWNPSGTLRFWDSRQNKFVALEGAQVLIRQWFTVRQGITNAAGYYRTNSVRGNARYILQWERYNYSIRNGSLFQAETRGPKEKNRAWNIDIKGGDDEYHAMIHTAAYDYYYGNRFGLISPPKNGTLVNQLKIAARELSNSGVPSSYSHIRNDLSLGVIAQIHIKAWGKIGDVVYATTIHELSHAAHSVLDRISYDNVVRDAYIIPWQGGAVKNNNRRLLETWAATVENKFVTNRYTVKYPIFGYLYNANLQNKTIAEENHYTSAGIDMIDNVPQGTASNKRPIDRVSGYTINQLELSLIGAKSWFQWRDNIKTKIPSNSTKVYLDELFNNWPN